MQTIHDSVTVLITQRELQARSTRLDASSAATTALQYVAENSGFDIITFRVNFSKSANIKLHRPAARTDEGSDVNALQKATEELAFECKLHPFERCVLAYVVKKGKKRAFVRVHYEVTAVATPSVDAIVKAQERITMTLQRQLQRSINLFSHVSKWTAIPCRSQSEVERACAEINRYFKDFGDVFVDASFLPTAQSLYDPEAADKLSEADSAVYTLCSWEHLHRTADSSWTLMGPPKTRSKSPLNESASIASFTSGLPSQDSFLCALSIIAPYCELWFCRWFPALNAASGVENMAAVSVALCNEGLTWQHFIIDLFCPSFPLGRGLMSPRNIHGELYATLLHKAYAKLKGSYTAVSRIPTITILQELTGSLWVCLYRCFGEEYVVQSNEQERLQHVVQTTLLPRSQRRELCSPEPNVIVVATFGKIDNHHRAFRLTILSHEDPNTSFVVLHDDSARYLRDKLAANLAEFDRDQDPAEPRVSWEQLMVLEPAVWSLSLGRQHEQRLRRIYLHQSDTVEMTSVISVPTLTTIAFSCSYLNHFASKTHNTERHQDQVDLSLSVALVETDFSFTPIEDSNNMPDMSLKRQHRLVSSDSVCSHQLVRTLSAGEYVVTISAKRPGLTESHPPQAEEGESPSAETVLSPATIDENLQLVFDCLDREGKHELSESDIASFLQLQERMLPSQHGKEAIRAFMHRHGSSTSAGSRLTLDDFREIYLALAVQDCNESQPSTALLASTLSSTSIRARFQELVWQDLLHLLPGSCSGDDCNIRSKIDCQEIVEIVCCIHSDAPLLNVIPLADVETNNFNM